MNSRSTSERNRYNEKFKREVVRDLIDNDKPVNEIALSLGIEQSILYRWKKKYGKRVINNDRQDSVNKSEFEDIRSEIESLKEDVNQLRFIIKKCFHERYNE